MFITVNREYRIRTGLLSVRLNLYVPEGADSNPTLDLIRDIDLNYGFEDQEDLLTFYPNTVKLTFDDFDKKNHKIIELSVTDYNNTLPENRSAYGGVEIWLDNVRKFSGFIDPLTLTYNTIDKTVSFEAVCCSSQLKNITVDRNNYINTDGSIIADNSNVSFLLILYGIYKQVWSDFEWNLYDSSLINSYAKGVFCKHDWRLRGDAVFPSASMYADWSLTHASGGVEGLFGTFMNYDSTKFFGEDRVCNTYADLLRILALQFGAVIGVEDVNKVYFVKRFGLSASNAVDVSDNVIKFTKTLHLNPLRGVEVINDWNGIRYFNYGDIERTSNNEFKYPDKISQFTTYIGSYNTPPSQGTCIYIYDQTRLYPVWGYCWDPALTYYPNPSAMHELVGKWTRENRKTGKERVETELYGIDYSMAKTYKINPDSSGVNQINFRPISMTKKPMKNTTQMTGLQL